MISNRITYRTADGVRIPGFPEGGEASAHELADWKFCEPKSWLTPELLVAEVRDTIDQLNGRPDSTGRCLAAVDIFLADRTEANRAAARAAFLNIPKSQRRIGENPSDRAVSASPEDRFTNDRVHGPEPDARELRALASAPGQESSAAARPLHALAGAG
ncbi:hypothetical protein ACFRIC_40255 [Streptomyces sp. NPDC056738]|uniref:DUF7639 domain-containing protein n=1 Tax=Streptomyces sp. NPDC056738 TaxID=3345933 RepID=UPI00369D6772